MGLIIELNDFAIAGNVVDMTVGNMIGGLFGKILSSLVIDVIILVVGVISLREVSSSSVTAGQ